MSQQITHKENAIYKVDIDFDDASHYWRENKEYIGNGSFKYVCESICKNGNKCVQKCVTGKPCCKMHLKKYNL